MQKGSLGVLMAFACWIPLFILIARAQNDRFRRWTPRPPRLRDAPMVLSCGCGKASLLKDVSEDGACPRCGFADDFIERAMLA